MALGTGNCEGLGRAGALEGSVGMAGAVSDQAWGGLQPAGSVHQSEQQ